MLHEIAILKYRELSLDKVNGKFRDLTKKQPGVTACWLRDRNKIFTVKLAFRSTSSKYPLQKHKTLKKNVVASKSFCEKLQPLFWYIL